MSDVAELRAALNLSEGDFMHGDNLLLHAAQRIRGLESVNAEFFKACQEFVRKVDEGEARSVASYKQMKAALKKHYKTLEPPR